MPNTLVHFATHGVASRGLWRRLDPRWIYLGCMLPDVPWIVRRAVVGVGLPIDPFDLRLYTMAQASLAGTLLLCAALAAVTVTPRLVFSVLGLNACLHLLLDAAEKKWGNGVHLFAPFSWHMTSFEIVTGDSYVLFALAVGGALLLAWEIARPRVPLVGLALRPVRLGAAGVLLCAYLAAPLAVLGAVEASDSYSVRTLRDVPGRPGRAVSLDRTAFLTDSCGGFVEIWTGERVRVSGVTLDHNALVSLHGTFLGPSLLRVDRFDEHRKDRDWPTRLALGLLALLWARPLVAAGGQSAKTRVAPHKRRKPECAP